MSPERGNWFRTFWKNKKSNIFRRHFLPDGTRKHAEARWWNADGVRMECGLKNITIFSDNRRSHQFHPNQEQKNRGASQYRSHDWCRRMPQNIKFYQVLDACSRHRRALDDLVKRYKILTTNLWEATYSHPNTEKQLFLKPEMFFFENSKKSFLWYLLKCPTNLSKSL